MAKQTLINEGRYVDLFLVYYMAKRFILPFRRWTAFDLGIIDEKGKRTKKRITTTEEKNSYTLLDRMIRKIRVFVGDRWFLKLTLAYLLLKEDADMFPSRKTLLTEDDNLSSQFSVKTNPLEEVTVKYTKTSDDFFDFSIFSSLKDTEENDYRITSIFEVHDISKDSDFLDNLDFAFNSIGESNSLSFTIRTAIEYVINISIGVSEFKISSPLGNFYTVFNTTEQVKEFQNKWNEIVSNA